ncbi:MAG: hypothetical protein Q4B47_01790 [Eubacteriales bacterium]|nr:hypothetical protein [Eubacteriales bacterium]
MAKRYRYAFAKKKEAAKGKLAVGLAVASFLLFILDVILSFALGGKPGYVIGGIALFASVISIYGFIMGLSSFSEEDRKHRTSLIGSILNGLIMVGWLGMFLSGL